MIFDCCHSGTMSRGGEGNVRGLPPSLFGVEQGARGGVGAEDSRALGDDAPGLVALYASESFARTPEIDVAEAGGARHGLLTWSLAQELRAGLEGRTYRQLFADVTRAYSAREVSETVPMGEGDLDREVGTRLERGPSEAGALTADRLRVAVDPAAPEGARAELSRLLGERPELFELVVEGADVRVGVEGERFLLRSSAIDIGGLELGEVVQRLAAHQLMSSLEQAIAGGALASSGADLALRVERKPLRGGPALEVIDGGAVHPGDRLRLALSKASAELFDVYVLYVDARLGITQLFPGERGSARIPGRLEEELDLLGDWTTITDDAQGDERLVLLAYAREAGDRVVSLGSLAWLAGARGDGGALQDLMASLSGSGTRAGDAAVVPRAQVLRLRCEWPALVAPPWPRRGVVPIQLPPLPPDPRAGLDSPPSQYTIERAAIVRSPGSRDYDLLLVGDENAPLAAFFDLDADRRERPSEAQLQDLATSGDFDAEVILHLLPEYVLAFYDTTDDGTFDLVLVDGDRDGWAETRLRNGAPEPVRVPILSQSHLPRCVAWGLDARAWTSRFSLLTGSL